jgi:hypothetical protein
VLAGSAMQLVEHWPSTYEVLGFIPSATKNKRNKATIFSWNFLNGSYVFLIPKQLLAHQICSKP